jgi:hypothetical protein
VTETDELHEGELPPAWEPVPAEERSLYHLAIERRTVFMLAIATVALILLALVSLVSQSRAAGRERNRSQQLEEQVIELNSRLGESDAQAKCRGDYAANVDAAKGYLQAAIGSGFAAGYEQSQARTAGNQPAVDAAAQRIAEAVRDIDAQSQGLLKAIDERLESRERCVAGLLAEPYPKPVRLSG